MFYVVCREKETGDVAAAKYLRQEKSKVRREAQNLRSLIQSAFVVRLAGLYESPLNSVLVTEYLAGGDLVTRYQMKYLHWINDEKLYESSQCSFNFSHSSQSLK